LRRGVGRCLALAAPLGIAALAAPRAHAETQFLPQLSAVLQAARYAPSDVDLVDEAWIGAAADLVEVDGARAYLDAGLETILGNTRRSFEATQANYHLEIGARRSFAERELGVFFHHVSRHAQDRAKPGSVDWNFLGVRASAPLPKEFFCPTRVTLGLARATRTSEIGYQWEFTGRLDADLVTRKWGRVYLAAGGRLVTTERSPLYRRNGFLDFQAESGVRLARESRSLELFLAYDYRNDVLITEPLVKSRALVGFRIASGRGRAIVASARP
jgi:hypothetical protein